jgi:hypothetical protein
LPSSWQRGDNHASRFTLHVSRFTLHVSRFTFHVLRFTLHAPQIIPLPAQRAHFCLYPDQSPQRPGEPRRVASGVERGWRRLIACATAFQHLREPGRVAGGVERVGARADSLRYNFPAPAGPAGPPPGPGPQSPLRAPRCAPSAAAGTGSGCSPAPVRLFPPPGEASGRFAAAPPSPARPVRRPPPPPPAPGRPAE